MSEIATAVVEKPQAPATPPQEVHGRGRMSYKPDDLPSPVNGPEQYHRAQLIETRLMRLALERIADLLEASATPSNPPVETPTPAPARARGTA